ncbi:MAG: hypothetical protein HGA75_05800 [Thiobacillus sp.]|nr:hypothetical protein [Thiobacillus sp.]
MLAEHYLEKARAFLKTVVCFDDEPVDGNVRTLPKTRIAIRADSGFDDNELANRIDQGDQLPSQHIEDSHPLYFHSAVNAFAEVGILCSVLKPDQSGDLLVKRIADLANSADVTVLDWELEGRAGGSVTCKKAIKKILDNDVSEGGRLRLIVVFTGTDGRLAVEDLAQELATLGGARVDGEFALTGNHWRVVVFQKPDTNKPTAEPVPYSELPRKVVAEFAKLTNGLLPSAILHGITEIRNNTHRLLAVFDGDLDGAFLTHRALIPDPNDAEDFLLEMVQDELGAIMRKNGFKNCVGGARSTEWIKSKNICQESDDKRNSLLKAVTDSSKDKIIDFSGPFQQGNKDKKKVADKILQALYGKNQDVADSGSQRLSQLAGLYGAGIPSTVDDLRMQLGTLVRDVDGGNRYLMCLQPLCDSVRISEPTLFPFLILDAVTPENGAKYKDLYVKPIEGDGVWLQITPSPKKLLSYLYDPVRNDGCSVWKAKLNNGVPRFEFVDGDKTHTLVWIGEVKLGKAQRVASGIAARFHTLGVDEFEWQRLNQKAGN